METLFVSQLSECGKMGAMNSTTLPEPPSPIRRRGRPARPEAEVRHAVLQATLELLRLTELSFFAMVGLVLSVQLAAIWLLVLQRTLRGVWHGELFQAPCLGGPQSAAHGVFSAD